MNHAPTKKKRLDERMGVANGMETLAKYILRRCDMFSKTDTFEKKSGDRYGFNAFYISRSLLEKYSPYPIPDDCKRLAVCCREMSESYAAVGYNKYWGYSLYLPPEMFYGRSEKNKEYLGNIMHELTHFLNYNQKNKAGNVYTNRSEIGSETRELVEDLVYYFQDSEMNAHLTGFYYELKKDYELYKDEEDGSVCIYRKRGRGAGSYYSLSNLKRQSISNLKRQSIALGWGYMWNAISTLMNEKTPDVRCYRFSTFPKNGNKGMSWGSYFGNDPYSNVYFAILYVLKRHGGEGNSVIKLPDYDFYFGKSRQVWKDGNWDSEFNDTDTQELAMKYVLLKNKIRNQFSQKWEDFNKRADKVAYMWYEEELKKLNDKKEETLFQKAVNEAFEENKKETEDF